MKFLISNIHWILIAWVGFQIYDGHLVQQEKLNNLQSQIPILQKRVEKKQKILDGIKRQKQFIDETKSKIEAIALEIEKLQQQLPTDISETDNLQMIRDVSTKLNLKGVRLSPKGEANKGFYFSSQYELTARGTFLQFLVFLEQLGKKKQLLNIKSLKFKRSDSRRGGRFQIVEGVVLIEAFRYNPDFQEDRGFEKIEKEIKDSKRERKG